MQFCEMLLQHKAALDVIVACLECTNMYVRFDVLQLISLLYEHLPVKLPRALLALPTGLARIIDLLEDERQIIRGEVLLLLGQLTASSMEIQKIAVFESSFERLFDLILAEGGPYEGDTCVRDALLIAQNLVRFNPSNQTFFRESLSFTRLPSLLVRHTTAGAAQEAYIWGAAAEGNVIALLAFISLLLDRDNPRLEGVQNGLVALPSFLDGLIRVALSRETPSMVSTHALEAIDRLLFHNAHIQGIFGRHAFSGAAGSARPHPLPTSLIVIHIAVNGADRSNAERLAASNVIGSFLIGNGDNQLAIAATFKSPAGPVPSSDDYDDATDCLSSYSAGSIIIEGLLGQCRRSSERERWASRKSSGVMPAPGQLDSERIYFSALLLAHVVRDNDQCKRMALDYYLEAQLATSPEAASGGDGGDEGGRLSLFAHVIADLTERVKDDGRFLYASVGYLLLLSAWLTGTFSASGAVAAFLREGSNVQFVGQHPPLRPFCDAIERDAWHFYKRTRP